MSAAIVLQRRDAAYMLTDAARYYADGTIESFVDKCTVVDEARCAITVLGPSLWQPVIAEAIRESFDCYDAVKAGIEPLARRLYDEHADAIEWEHGTTGELWVVGFSHAQGRGEAFTLILCDDAEWEIWQQRSPGIGRVPFEPDVQRVPLNANPLPASLLTFRAANFTLHESGEDYQPEIDLLHFAEIQRRIPLPGAWPHLVGGYATLTRVDHLGVTQRVIHTWEEDCVGEKIEPAPIDWVRWRAEREGGKPISRLKADALKRRAAKAQRRLAGQVNLSAG